MRSIPTPNRAVLAALTIVAVVVYGWILNIVKLVELGDSLLTVEGALRVVGVPVVPLGAILGYFV